MSTPTNKKHKKIIFAPFLILGVVLILLVIMYAVSSFMGIPNNDKGGYGYMGNVDKMMSQGWKKFEHPGTGVEFSYPENWTLEPQRIEHGSVITVAPSDVQDTNQKIKIFILDNAYYGMEGLPTKTININGKDGVMVDEGLYGFMHNKMFITLDAGYANDIKPYFAKIVESLRFE